MRCNLKSHLTTLFVILTILVVQAQGPYQPEHTSFESISTTDMVNLSTGDFTYNIPLIHVPGPEGGFSMPLSYHAGIKLNQEASWVGLGWNINPGAITRSISQYPDDYNGQRINVVAHNDGEETHTVILPLQVIGIPVTLVLSWNTERGFGGSVGYKGFVSVGVGTQAGVTVMGVEFTPDGISADAQGVASSIVSIASGGLSGDGGLEGNIGEVADAANTASNVVSIGQTLASLANGITNINNWTIVDYYYAVGLFYTKKKVFLHKDVDKYVYGSLYLGTPEKNYDTQTIINNNSVFPSNYFNETTIHDAHIYMEGNEYAYQINPTSIAYDYYSIAANNISGSISPYRTDVGSLSMSNYRDNYKALQLISFRGGEDYKVQFKYSGAVSNYYNYHNSLNEESIYLGNNNDWFGCGGLCYKIDRSDYLVNNVDITRNPSEYNTNTNELATGKNVKWYSNEEIGNGTATLDGFVDFLKESDRVGYRNENNNLPSSSIGGYSVTNTNGLTYHFAHPVYNLHQQNLSSSGSDNYIKTTMNHPYASAWLLTAITGPDYVSRGDEGVISENDWGYWVKFEYVRFSNRYDWRFPYEGKSYSSNNNYKGNYTEGSKELWYLNSIHTRSHTAIFVKEERLDNRSSSNESVPQGGESLIGIESFANSPSLKLSEIIVLDNDAYETIKPWKESHNNLNNTHPRTFYSDTWDSNDLSSESIAEFIKENQVKRYVFNTDYSLCENTPSSQSSNKGKLSLNEVIVYEKDNIQVLPSYKFEYGENPDYNKDKWDGWGMYKSNGIANKYEHAATPHAEHWSLNKITSPLGGEIHIDYERDTYASASGEQIFTSLVFQEFNSNKSIILSELHQDLTVGDVVDLNFTKRITILNRANGFTTSQNYDFYTPSLTISSIANNIIYFEEHCSPDLLTMFSFYLADSILDIIGSPTVYGTIQFKTTEKYGGDLRVAKISTADELQNKQTTKYIYTKNGKPDGLSSGCVSVEPQFIKAEERSFEKYYDYPVTPVLYEKVTVLNGAKEDGSYLTKDQYNFVVPNSNMIAYNREDHEVPSSFHKNFTMEINVKTSSIGKLKSIKNFNANGELFKEIDYSYVSTGGGFGDLGLYTEGSILAEDVKDEWNTFHKLFLTTKTYHPSILKSLTINEGGVVKRIENTKYDLVTGNVLETEYSNSLGEMFRSEVIPAYHKYPEMGSKALNPNNKNMMRQNAADYLYSLNGVGEEEVISASVQTWNEDWTYRDFNSNSEKFEYTTSPNSNIWRKHKTYIWNGPLNDNGTYANFTDFDWDAAPHSNWKNVQEYTLFNHYSKPLEVQDINYNKSASKMGYGNAHTLLAAANSRYTESYYSGAEDKLAGTTHYFEGEVKGANKQSNTYAHTGEYSVKTFHNTLGFSVSGTIGHSSDFSVQDYRASVWVHKNFYKKAQIKYKIRDASNAIIHQGVSNYTSPATVKAGDWYLLQLDIPKSEIEEGSKIKVYTSVLGSFSSIPICYFDDFRLLPLKASLNAYVYDKWGNLTAVLDPNNLATRYHYDEAGRLLKVEREFADDVEDDGGFKKMKEFEYNYAREIE